MTTSPIVVVMEDDPQSAEALALVLSDWGAEPVVGDRPGPVLRQLGARAGEISCIIADYHLGGDFTGIEAIRALSEHAPEARVLVLTGAFDNPSQARSSAAGHDVIFKPARADAIVAWLETR